MDHFGQVVVLIPVEIFAKELYHTFIHLLDETRGDGLVHEEEVRSHAGLAGIHELSSADFVAEVRKVGIRIDNTRALSAKFQNAGGQIVGSSEGHVLSSNCATRENDAVEVGRGAFLCGFNPSLDAPIELLIQEGLNQDLLDPGALWRPLRRLVDAAVAGGDTHGHVGQSRSEGVVPGRHHQGDSQRLGPDLAPARA